MHGSAPHAYVLCHQAGAGRRRRSGATRSRRSGDLVELHERTALLARPARVAAIALNTRPSTRTRRAARAAAEAETGLPAAIRCVSAPASSWMLRRRSGL